MDEGVLFLESGWCDQTVFPIPAGENPGVNADSYACCRVIIDNIAALPKTGRVVSTVRACLIVGGAAGIQTGRADGGR